MMNVHYNYSEGSMFRRSCRPKVLCSKITRSRFYVPKVPVKKKIEGSIRFQRFYVAKFQIVHPIESGVSVRRLAWWITSRGNSM